MNKHFRILAFLYLAMGALSLFVSIYFVYAIYTSGPWSFSPETQNILIEGGYGTFMLVLLIIATLGTLLTGWALYKMHRYARTLATIFAVLGLFDFPLGTMLGIYTLWALSQKEENHSWDTGK